jgi:hypothetical protein
MVTTCAGHAQVVTIHGCLSGAPTPPGPLPPSAYVCGSRFTFLTKVFKTTHMGPISSPKVKRHWGYDDFWFFNESH